MGMTVVEKIFARASGRRTVRAGDEVPVRPDHMIAYDFPGVVDRFFAQMNQLDIKNLDDPDRYVVFVDHMLSKNNKAEHDLRESTRDLHARWGFRLHENVGIGHQAMLELGYARPGALLVHHDGHVSAAGAVGALGFGVRRDLIEAWSTGQIHLRVPQVAEVWLLGDFQQGVDARDLLHHLIATEGASGFLGCVIHFRGEAAARLSVDQRLSLCSMAMFTGADSAIFDSDQKAIDYVTARSDRGAWLLESDADAKILKSIIIQLDRLEPQIVRPGSAKADHTVAVLQDVGTKIDRAYIGSCSSGRFEDLEAAAQILEGRTVAPGVELHVVPTSTEIFEKARTAGLLDVLERAGARIHKSTCDFCFGYAQPLSAGQVCISSGVLNVAGRMGSTQAGIFLANPYTVAASALAGSIVDPREFL
ncbi:hypothetical protein LN996_17640 [Arthrobacter sp. AK01]|uniref:3-isopropylmalate dehydratase large subunit n=1 Tax=Arthrobacter sp. AK01 TaxID=2894084 RepID=UPI001E2D00AD|nr:aconitase family protein [Arthrobacter sp. AK01]MCD4852642.1 hypothetical protein [Arthrobacter sp. AK01]